MISAFVGKLNDEEGTPRDLFTLKNETNYGYPGAWLRFVDPKAYLKLRLEFRIN